MTGLSDKQEGDARKAAYARWGSVERAPSLAGEEWRPVPSLPGYEASSLGRVRSAYAVLLGTPQTKQGHLYVSPSVAGKQRPVAVHRMVCEAFHGPCPPEQECRHIDGDAANNAPVNLMWGTRIENQRDRHTHGTSNAGERNGRAKLTAIQAKAIYDRVMAGEARTVLAAEYGTTLGQVGLIVGGFRWAKITGALPKKR